MMGYVSQMVIGGIDADLRPLPDIVLQDRKRFFQVRNRVFQPCPVESAGTCL